MAALLAVFLAGVPLTTLHVERTAYGAASHTQHAEQVARRQVPAVLLAGPPAATYPPYQKRTARWTAPDGTTHTGEVLASVLAPARASVMVWMDRSGQLTGPPLTRSQASGQAVLTAVFAALLLALVLLAAAILAHRALDQRRMTAWGTEWQSTGPHWTQRR